MIQASTLPKLGQSLTVDALLANFQDCVDAFDRVLLAGRQYNALSHRSQARQLLFTSHTLCHAVLETIGALGNLGRIAVAQLCLLAAHSACRADGPLPASVADLREHSRQRQLRRFETSLAAILTSTLDLLETLEISEQCGDDALSLDHALKRTSQFRLLARTIEANIGDFILTWPAKARDLDLGDAAPSTVGDMVHLLSTIQASRAPTGVHPITWASVKPVADRLNALLTELVALANSSASHPATESPLSAFPGQAFNPGHPTFH